MILVKKKEAPYGKGKEKTCIFFSNAHIPMSSLSLLPSGVDHSSELR